MKREVKFIFLKGDEDMIDHIKCINELKCLYWTKGRKRFAIGDICYLYLTNGGYNQICYKLKVANTSTSRKDEKFWKVPFFPDPDCIKLIPISSMYEGNYLKRADLENIGISRYIQSYRYLDKEQVDYIEQELQK